IEAQWKTQPAPASWYLFAWPDQKNEKNYWEIKIPYALSLIATHSLTGTVEGADPIIENYKVRVKNGIKAYVALHEIWDKTATAADVKTYQDNINDLGFAYLLKPF